MHRVAVIRAGTLDSLPHNGAVVTLLAVCTRTHRESYLDIVMVSIVGAIIALAVVIVLEPPSDVSSGCLSSRMGSGVRVRANSVFGERPHPTGYAGHLLPQGEGKGARRPRQSKQAARAVER